MTKYRFPTDRSVAYTILAEVMPGFVESPDDGGRTVSRFLKDWWENSPDDEVDMYEFAQDWAEEQ